MLNQDDRILASRPISVEAVPVNLDADEEVEAEGELSVEWVGPDARGDFISIAEPSMKPDDYSTFAYTSGGSPLVLKVPNVPSTYELRYILSDTGEILERRGLSVVTK